MDVNVENQTGTTSEKIAVLLAFVGLAMMCYGTYANFTPSTIYRLVMGEVGMMVAMAHGFALGRQYSGYALTSLVMWLVIATIFFASASGLFLTICLGDTCWLSR
jgi:hypothetical protein